MSPLALILEMSGGIALGAIFVLDSIYVYTFFSQWNGKFIERKKPLSSNIFYAFRKGLMGFALQIECADCNTDEVKKC